MCRALRKTLTWTNLFTLTLGGEKVKPVKVANCLGMQLDTQYAWYTKAFAKATRVSMEIYPWIRRKKGETSYGSVGTDCALRNFGLNPAWLSKRPYDEKSLPGCNITAPANAGVYKRIAPLVQMQPWLWRIPLLEIWSLKMVYALDWPDGGRRRQDYRNVVEGFRRMKSKQDLIRGVALTRLGRRKPD